jgi:uncharacterized membrane protein YedE/YeeE
MMREHRLIFLTTFLKVVMDEYPSGGDFIKIPRHISFKQLMKGAPMQPKTGKLAVILCMLLFITFMIGILNLLGPELSMAQTEAVESAAQPTEDAGLLSRKQWSPYAVGIGIGILSMLVFVFSDTSIGASTAYARAAGMIEKRIWGEKIEQKPFYQKIAPVIDWQVLFVGGILIGAFLSAILSGDFRISFLPSVWQGAIGDTWLLRWVTALIGGGLISFGARWAGGCTSGHGISGTLQLSVSSWLAVICFFAGGIVVAHLIY